ncbi:hypothetical protein F2Q68_00024116 [Brassica cretica]|uniref:ACT domain-containing protein n=1 Tax=Brassica cretica TaxID=69181 RepID=A0A8S9IFT5_BRACR|nr:hypothetical protein F2Q68_00024116 [Brassica cretica]
MGNPPRPRTRPLRNVRGLWALHTLREIYDLGFVHGKEELECTFSLINWNYPTHKYNLLNFKLFDNTLRVFYDVTIALKSLGICIFSADEIGRHSTLDRQWKVYRFLLDERCEFSLLASLRERDPIVDSHKDTYGLVKEMRLERYATQP